MASHLSRTLLGASQNLPQYIAEESLDYVFTVTRLLAGRVANHFATLHAVVSGYVYVETRKIDAVQTRNDSARVLDIRCLRWLCWVPIVCSTSEPDV
jgi:hypothetical protein